MIKLFFSNANIVIPHAQNLSCSDNELRSGFWWSRKYPKRYLKIVDENWSHGCCWLHWLLLKQRFETHFEGKKCIFMSILSCTIYVCNKLCMMCNWVKNTWKKEKYLYQNSFHWFLKCWRCLNNSFYCNSSNFWGFGSVRKQHCQL